MTPSPSAGEPPQDVELKRCPFCGCEASMHENDYCEPPEWSAYCLNMECGAHTAGYADKSTAIAAWNRRAAPPATASEQDVERVAEALAIHAGHDSWRDLPETAQEAAAIHGLASCKDEYRAEARVAIAALPASGERERQDKRYNRLLGSFTELQAAAQHVVDETDRIHDSSPWPTKYRAPYGAIVKLRELLGRQYGLRALASPAAAGDEK